MIIVHGGMLDDQFLLWGELAQTGSRARKARVAAPGALAPNYPYAVARGALLAAVQRSIPSLTTFAGSKRYPIWLPSVQGLPLPSLAEVNGHAAEAALQPWLVSTVPLAPAALVTLLAACAQPEKLDGDLCLGPEMQAWVRALQLAQSLVVRQRVLPSLAEEETGYFTSWVPLLRGPMPRSSNGWPKGCQARAAPLCLRLTSIPSPLNLAVIFNS